MNQSIVKNNARRQESCSRSVVSGVRSEGVVETRSQCSCKTDTESVGTEQRDGMHDARRGNTLFDAPRVSSNDAEKEKRINLLPDTGGGGGEVFLKRRWAMGDGSCTTVAADTDDNCARKVERLGRCLASRR